MVEYAETAAVQFVIKVVGKTAGYQTQIVLPDGQTIALGDPLPSRTPKDVLVHKATAYLAKHNLGVAEGAGDTEAADRYREEYLHARGLAVLAQTALLANRV